MTDEHRESESRRCISIALAWLLVGVAASAHAQTTTHTEHYAIDFSSPTHTVGQPPTVGAGPKPRDTPTAINFGSPTVVASYGALTDQPLLFSTSVTAYHQIELDMEGSSDDVFFIDFDITIGSLSTSSFSTDGFTLNVDVATAHGVRFHADGTITGLAIGDPTVIGSWTPGQVLSVSLVVNNEPHVNSAQLWQFFLDGELMAEQQVSIGGLQQIRLGLAMNDPTGLSEVAIDDIQVASDHVSPAPPAPHPTAPIALIINSGGDGLGNELNLPKGVAVDPSGNAFVAGYGTNNVFRITQRGVITELIDEVGGAGQPLDSPLDVDTDSSGNLYVVGSVSGNVFKITSAGSITVLIDSSGDGAGNSLLLPRNLAVDADDNVYVSAATSDNVFRITPEGTITEIIDAGSGILEDPRGLAVDAAGNVFVACETTNNVVRIAPGGSATEIIDASGDGAGNPLSFARDVAVDDGGNVYVVGAFSNNAFRIAPGGMITEIIDSTGDGAGTGLSVPGFVEVDADGNVYVAGSGTVFEIAPGGAITEIVQEAGGWPMTGTPVSVFIDGLAVTAEGIVYASGNNTHDAVRIGSLPAGVPSMAPLAVALTLGALLGSAYRVLQRKRGRP